MLTFPYILSELKTTLRAESCAHAKECNLHGQFWLPTLCYRPKAMSAASWSPSKEEEKASQLDVAL